VLAQPDCTPIFVEDEFPLEELLVAIWRLTCRHVSAVTGKHLASLLFAALAAVLFLSASLSSAVALASAQSHFSASDIGVTPQEMENFVGKKINEVDEFKFIAETAERLGLRVYLFGGTASAFLHYAKWDMQRQHGDPRFQADRFDYDFTNIFRSTQDLDIVVDGEIKNVDSFRQSLQSKFPHFAGSKAGWEVRLLNGSLGTPGQPGFKEALLDSYDFKNQNTDSNSTGLIDISRTPEHHRIRDLRNWNKMESEFLKDSLADRINYIDSPLHETTSRAKLGENPKIISVIRALTKAFQYELSFSPEDKALIQKIINEFDPKQMNDVSLRWMKKNGKKLFQHAVDLEYAWTVIDQLGLRKKLAQVDSPSTQDSLAWWMEKEPLRSKPLGQGTGQTARELFGDQEVLLSHETSGFLPYESICRSHKGVANFFISREGKTGEFAVHGNGVYTMIGKQGARNTGFTIRMRLNPKAKLDVDFKRGPGDMIIILNRSAVNIIPESLNITVGELFKMVSEGKEFDQSDKGIYEKVLRRAGTKSNALPKEELEQVKSIVHKAINGAWSNGFLVGKLAIDLKLRPEALGLSKNDYARMLLLDGNSSEQELFAKARDEKIDVVEHVEVQLRNGNGKYLGTWIQFQTMFPTWNDQQWLDASKFLFSQIHFNKSFDEELLKKIATIISKLTVEQRDRVLEKWITEHSQHLGEFARVLFYPLAKQVSEFGSIQQLLRISKLITPGAWNTHIDVVRLIRDRATTLTIQDKAILKKGFVNGTIQFRLADIYIAGLYEICPSCFEKVKFQDSQEVMEILQHERETSAAMLEKIVSGKVSSLMAPGKTPPTFDILISGLFNFSAKAIPEKNKREFLLRFLRTADHSTVSSYGNVIESLKQILLKEEFINFHEGYRAAIEFLIKGNYSPGLSTFVSAFKHYPDAERAVLVIQAAEKLNPNMLSSLVDAAAFDTHNENFERNRESVKIFDLLLDSADRRNDIELLLRIVEKIFTGPPHTQSLAQIDRALAIGAKLKVGSILFQVVNHTYDNNIHNRDRAQYLNVHNALLTLIAKSNDVKALETLASHLRPVEYPLAFYVRMFRVVNDLKATNATSKLIQSFDGFAVRKEDRKEATILLAKTVASQRDARNVYDFIRFIVMKHSGPSSVEIKPAALLLANELKGLALTSTDPKDRQFLEFVDKELGILERNKGSVRLQLNDASEPTFRELNSAFDEVRAAIRSKSAPTCSSVFG
jgi:hypothetical protein